MRFILLGATHEPMRVRELHDDRKVLELDGTLPAAIEPGQGFELRGDEPAAMLGARLITGSAIGNSTSRRMLRSAIPIPRAASTMSGSTPATPA